MRQWIFQANPKHFDIEGALTALDEIRWRVPQYTDEIQPGDAVVIWRSGNESGIIGVGMVASDPFESAVAHGELEFVLSAKAEGNPETRVALKVRPADYVPKAVIEQQGSMGEHQIIRAPMGTVFRLEQAEWDDIAPLLSVPLPVFDGATPKQFDLPLPYAWKDRRKDTYPLPGGNDEYLTSLVTILNHVILLRPTIDDLSEWLKREFGSSQSNARKISLFLRRAGFVRESAGLLELSEISHRFMESQDGNLVVAQLHARIRFIGEMLGSLRSKPASTDSLLSIANDSYLMSWSTKAQIQRRRGWLQSAGAVEQDDEGRLILTASGRDLLAKLELRGPEIDPAMSNSDLAETEIDAAGPPAVSTEKSEVVTSLIAKLHRTSVDSANPADFENVIRDVFEFLGFRAEQLGGSGKTDVVADADLGRDDSYRVIIDGKTTSHGAIKADRVDWDTINGHRIQHEADYVVIAGPAFGGEELVKHFLNTLPGGFWTQFIIVMAVIFVLGFFLDFIEIAVVVVPIVAPILLADPSANVTAVWLGVMIGLNIQTSFLTPPFGFALFYLRGVAPASVKTTQIYKGVVAFIALQILALVIVGFNPALVNYLPNRLSLTSENAPPPLNPKLQYCMENYVSERFETEGPDLRRAIAEAQALDLSTLPRNVRRDVEGAFENAEGTFVSMAAIGAAEDEVERRSDAYRPLHVEVRALTRRIDQIDEELSDLATDLRRADDEVVKQRYAARIASLEAEKADLEALVPAEWDGAHENFKVLTKAESDARTLYRRQSDRAYAPVVDAIAVIGGGQALAGQRDVLTSLRADLPGLDKEAAEERIKEAERAMDVAPDTNDIRSLLSKARREYRRTPDMEKVMAWVDEAIETHDAEVSWRTAAQEAVLPGLTGYTAALADTIGLRQQPQLPREQALYVASCSSAHRNISLSF